MYNNFRVDTIAKALIHFPGVDDITSADLHVLTPFLPSPSNCCFIITQQIKESLHHLLPKVETFLKQKSISVVSARERYAAMFPHGPQKWKICSFRDLVQDFKAGDTAPIARVQSLPNINSAAATVAGTTSVSAAAGALINMNMNVNQPPLDPLSPGTGSSNIMVTPDKVFPPHTSGCSSANTSPTDASSSSRGHGHGHVEKEELVVVSIGDGLHERYSLLYVCGHVCSPPMPCVSLKLADNPCPAELLGQLKYLSSRLPALLRLAFDQMHPHSQIRRYQTHPQSKNHQSSLPGLTQVWGEEKGLWTGAAPSLATVGMGVVRIDNDARRAQGAYSGANSMDLQVGDL